MKRVSRTFVFAFLLVVGFMVLVPAKPAYALCDGWASSGSTHRNSGNGCKYTCNGSSWSGPKDCDGQGNGVCQGCGNATAEQRKQEVARRNKEAQQQVAKQGAAKTAQIAAETQKQRAAEAVRQQAIIEQQRQQGYLTDAEAKAASQKAAKASGTNAGANLVGSGSSVSNIADYGYDPSSALARGVVPELGSSATGGIIVDGGEILPTSGSCEGLSNGQVGSSKFCGGAGNLYECSPIKLTNGLCNQRCGLTVSSSCAAQMGRTDLKGGERVGYITVRSLARGNGNNGTCSISSTPPNCDPEQDLRMQCTLNTGRTGLTCIKREEFRNAELGIDNDRGITAGNGQSVISKDRFVDEKGNRLFIASETNQGAYYVNGGAGALYGRGETRGETIVGGAGTSCSSGTFQTMISNGQQLTTQRGGDRGACGSAGECPDGQQRLCENGKLSSGCVKADACAYQVTPALVEGQSCAGLTRFSNGEPSNGIFVGCSGAENCFCSSLNGNSTVRCVPDMGNDSCGAAGRPDLVIGGTEVQQQENVTTVTTTTTTTTETPTASCNEQCGANAGGATCTGGTTCTNGVCRNPSCAPSEQNNQCQCEQVVNPPMCVDIFASTADPQLGEEVTFTCAEVTNATRYEFRYGYTTSRDSAVGMELFALEPETATSRTSLPIIVDKIGRYVAQCRPCAGNDLCSEWEPLDGQIGGPELEPVVTTESTDTTLGSESATNSTESTTEATESATTENTDDSSDEAATTSATTTQAIDDGGVIDPNATVKVNTGDKSEQLEVQAASTYSTDICWNRAYATSENISGSEPALGLLYNGDLISFRWPNGCRGQKDLGNRACTQALVDLTADEIGEWLAWAAAGYPDIEGCTTNR